MHCPECGQEIFAGSQFCENCGAPVARQQTGPVCANCGSSNQAEAEFCAECGARLGGEVMPMQSFCPECGAAVKQGAAFCNECGAKLNATASPATFVCPECGELLSPDAVFCGNCGMSLRQGAEYASAAPEATTAAEYQPSFPPDAQNYSQQQDWAQPQAQDWEYSQQQAQYQYQMQSQDQEFVRQEEEYQSQVQPQLQNWEPIQPQQQEQPLPQKSNRNKMLMAAAATVVLLVVGITGFWKPGFLLDWFRPTAKLENGVLALNDIAFDFKQTNLANGKATLTTVKDKEVEVQNGLIGDLYVMKYDKSCQGKVTVSVPVPKDFKSMNDEGVHMKLGIGRDYPLADGKTTRYYEYYDATVKDGKAIAVIDPATAGLGRHKSNTSAKPAKETPDLGEFTEYVGIFWKQVGVLPKVIFGEGANYGEGYQYSKGHFRLWYSYNILSKSRNVYIGGDDAQKLLGDLEDAYNYYKTNGFADYVDAFTPIDVYIEDTNDEGGWFPKSGNMQLREKTVFGDKRNERYEGDRRTNVRKTIYHEFFHAVQQGIIDSKTTLWFDEATATHFERVVYPDAVPENGQSFFKFVWKGLLPENNEPEEGYGREVLIQYISSKMGGNAWIKECYQNWSADYSKLKSIIKGIAGTEADFAADFYMEVIKKTGHLRYPAYYRGLRDPDLVSDGFLSGIKLKLDEKTKEKIKNGEADAFPAVFFSPSFELGGYGGHVVVLEMEEDSLPDNGQLKLEAEGGCRLQVIKFKNKTNNGVSSKNTVIKNPKEELKKGFVYLVLVTSTQPKKQNIRIKATLELLQEGIYNGKTTMTQGKKTATRNNVVGFRLSKDKDGKWGLNICQANGDYAGAAASVPLTYDAKQKIWKGHRKFKQELSKDPKKSKPETSTIDCTMKVNTEGKEPVIVVDYKLDLYRPWDFYSLRDYGSRKVHFEGKWSSELKGKNIAAKEEAAGKFVILE